MFKDLKDGVKIKQETRDYQKWPSCAHFGSTHTRKNDQADWRKNQIKPYEKFNI